MRSRFLTGLVALAIVASISSIASAAQFGAGLHYLRTLEEYKGVDDWSQDDFSLFGSITFPFVLLRVEGDLEWVPNYVGSDENLFQPAAYGLVPIGMLYGGAGIGIGYLTGDDNGWASNPFYALRAGIEFGLGGLALDAFLSYRFQSANFVEGAGNLDLDALTLAAQVKFGG